MAPLPKTLCVHGFAEAGGQIQRFRDFLPLEMADNVLAILESLPEDCGHMDEGWKSRKCHKTDDLDPFRFCSFLFRRNQVFVAQEVFQNTVITCRLATCSRYKSHHLHHDM